MKRKLVSIIAVACAAASLCALAACSDGGAQNGPVPGGDVAFTASAVFTASSDVTELTSTTSLKDYLDVLVDDGELSYEGYEGAYGFYITSVYGIAEQSVTSNGSSSGYSWLIYTDFLENDGVVYANPGYGVFDYNGKQLASASYGASGLPCVEGYTYALVYEAWSN